MVVQGRASVERVLLEVSAVGSPKNGTSVLVRGASALVVEPRTPTKRHRFRRVLPERAFGILDTASQSSSPKAKIDDGCGQPPARPSSAEPAITSRTGTLALTSEVLLVRSTDTTRQARRTNSPHSSASEHPAEHFRLHESHCKPEEVRPGSRAPQPSHRTRSTVPPALVIHNLYGTSHLYPTRPAENRVHGTTTTRANGLHGYAAHRNGLTCWDCAGSAGAAHRRNKRAIGMVIGVHAQQLHPTIRRLHNHGGKCEWRRICGST